MHICTVHLQVRRLVEIVEGGCQPEGSQHQQQEQQGGLPSVDCRYEHNNGSCVCDDADGGDGDGDLWHTGRL